METTKLMSSMQLQSIRQTRHLTRQVSNIKAPFTRYNLLSKRLSNRFDNPLNVCIHDTTGCQTSCQAVLTTGCIVYTNIQPNSGCSEQWLFVQHGCQTGCTTGTAVSCKQTSNRLSNRIDNRFDNQLSCKLVSDR